MTLFLARPALAQIKLIRCDPAPDVVLDHIPSEIFAWFSEPLSTGSHLSVFDGEFRPVDIGQTFIDANDATLMRSQSQLVALPPGYYTVNWKANAVDGSHESGTYDFVVRKAPGIPLQVAMAVGIAALVLAVLLGVLIWRKVEDN
jgi:methionine-rich copper-binding protein CopC